MESESTAPASVTIPTRGEPALAIALAVVRELTTEYGAVVETVDIDEAGEGEIVLLLPRG